MDLFEPWRVVVLAGTGGNGGGGLVAARHLTNRGRQVHVVLANAADRFRGVPAHQLPAWASRSPPRPRPTTVSGPI